MVESRKRVLMALIMAFSMFLAAIIIFYGSGDDVEAVKSDPDTKGYFYVDNKDPSPKVTYDWIDVKGSSGSIDMSLLGSSSYGQISLGWDFPFYDSTYSSIYVGARGYITLGSWYSSTSYSYGIPYSGSPNPLIAVAWSYGYGNAHYMTGSTNNVDWVAIEWSSNSYGRHFEAILYESGLIKMQYKVSGTSSYVDGNYCTIGIEDQAGAIGTEYSDYSDANVPDGTAVVYTMSEAVFYEPTIDNALMISLGQFEPETPVLLADMDYYKFEFDISTTQPQDGAGDLTDVKVFFGPPSLNIYAHYNSGGGGSQWNIGGGPTGPANGTIEVDIANSVAETVRFGDPWHLVVYVKFKFAFPWEGMMPMTIQAIGGATLPTTMTYSSFCYLDTGVQFEGEFQYLGEDGRHLSDFSYVKDNESVHFTGVKLLYNIVDLEDENATKYYVMNESFEYMIIDDELNEYHQTNASMINMSIYVNMPLDSVTKLFNLKVKGIPDNKVSGGLPSLSFKVDNSIPAAPSSVVIRADSFKDKQKEVDNDDILYLSWGSVTDSGSGVAYYRIATTPDPNNESAVQVDPRITQWIWNKTYPGEFKLYIWAVDNVGHVGEMASESIQIDKDDPFFTDFTWDVTQWARTVTPVLGVTARDGYTISEDISGIRRSSAEYAISTNGMEEFDDWISVGLFDDDVSRAIGDDDLEIEVQPRFIEGTENYIKFRIKDWAGNGYAESDIYNIKIDVTDVAFQDFFPTQEVWHNLYSVNEEEVSIYLADHTSGIVSNRIYYRSSHEIDESGNYIWETGVQQEGGWEEVSSSWYDKVEGSNLIWVHFEYGDFMEGELNFMQFMAKDEAGNGDYTDYPRGPWTISSLYQILVNTKPVAVISSPLNLEVYNITDLITLDGSQSYDIDVDKGNLKFEWKEGENTIGNDMIIENFRFETLGWHTLTLYVGDSGHRDVDRSVAQVTVNITKFVPSSTGDADDDGMDDLWEYNSLLDMYDSSDKNEDPDGDGYTNYQEYLGLDNVGPYKGEMDSTDPWDPVSKPIFPGQTTTDPPVYEAPFGIWIFILVIIAAIIVAALIVLIGYLRIHREEDSAKREEAEEEAMLATPQLDIPTMPANIPMVDPSMPTLPAPEAGEEAAALPPAQPAEAQPMDVGQPQPMEPQPMDMGQPQPVQDPIYQDPNQAQSNPMYEGQQ